MALGDLGDHGRFSDPSLLVMSSLADGPKHGYAMTKDIQRFAGVTLGPGTLYGALARLQHQGLIVAKGRVRGVRRLADLAKLGLRFVNRERGSGTRLLFDALLAAEGLTPARIKGYEHEEFTHMATAATVRAGMADAAFGIEAAARTHGLGFVPFVNEHYYLACARTTPARIAVDTMDCHGAQLRLCARGRAHWGLRHEFDQIRSCPH